MNEEKIVKNSIKCYTNFLKVLQIERKNNIIKQK